MILLYHNQVLLVEESALEDARLRHKTALENTRTERGAENKCLKKKDLVFYGASGVRVDTDTFIGFVIQSLLTKKIFLHFEAPRFGRRRTF